MLDQKSLSDIAVDKSEGSFCPLPFLKYLTHLTASLCYQLMFSWHILPLTPFPKSPLWVFPLPINKFRYFPVFLFLSFHFVCSFFKMSSLTARVLIATFSVGAPTFASLAHILPLSVRSAFTTVFLLFLLKCPTGIHLKFSSLSTHVSPIKIWWKICFFYGVLCLTE